MKNDLGIKGESSKDNFFVKTIKEETENYINDLK